MGQDLKYINKSLEKSFKILEILSKSIFPLKASNISRKAALSRTTTFRLLSVLSDLGYIHKNLSSNTYTCLLYTSPSPRDRTRSRMPSSA